jgi:anaerobic selenocysteine-containing dehydrogenase
MTEVNRKKLLTWEEDGYTVSRTTAWSAPGCHEGCGVICYVKDGKLVKVEGDPESPFNQGRLCPRCVVSPDVVYHPDRLLYPMKRDHSRRGDPDAWERCTWDEAYDLCESELKRIAKEYGPESIQVFCGTGRDILWQSQRLSYAIGSPNVTSYGTGLSCWMPRLVAYIMTMGSYCQADCSQLFPDRFDHDGYKIPEVMIIWGNNAPSSSSDGFYGNWIIECMERGTKLIVVDPRLTWLSARAEIWLQVRPAVDAALALSMLRVIVEEDLYDHDFVERWCFGFDEMVENAKKYDLDEMAEKLWIPKEKIQAAARMFAKANNGAVQLGLSLDMQRNGVSAVMGIIALMAICGNIDVPGGNIFTPTPGHVGTFGWGWDNLPQETQERLVGYNEYPMIRMGMRLAQPDLLLEQAEKDEPYPLRGGFMMGTNPLNCMGQPLDRVYKVLQKLEFIAVCDYVMTPTIQTLAEVVLPIAMFPERDSIQSCYANLGAIRRIAGIERPGEIKSDNEIVLELGKRFNEEMFPWADVDEMLDVILMPSGMSFSELKDYVQWYGEDTAYRRYETGKLRKDGKPGFNTPTGRIELYSSLAESMGVHPLPFYEEPFEGPYSTPEIYEEYPLILMTGTRNIQFFHSEHRQVKKLREICPDPFFEIHPDTAIELGIQEFDWCWIETRRARIRHRAHITESIHPKMSNVQTGWWFPEMDPHDDPMYGAWDVNPNLLLVAGHQGETGFGADCKALLCKIYKVKAGEM